MGVRPIQSSESRQICTLSGVQGKLYGEELIHLRDIEQALVLSIKEAEGAIGREAFFGKAAVAMQFVKLGCDMALWVMTMTPGAGIGATAVSMVYDRATIVSDVLNKPQDAGGTIGQALVEAHVDILSRSLDYLGKKQAGALIDAGKTFIKAQLALDEALKDMKANKDSGSGIAAAKRSLIAQLHRTRDRMNALTAQLAACNIN